MLINKKVTITYKVHNALHKYLSWQAWLKCIRVFCKVLITHRVNPIEGLLRDLCSSVEGSVRGCVGKNWPLLQRLPPPTCHTRKHLKNISQKEQTFPLFRHFSLTTILLVLTWCYINIAFITQYAIQQYKISVIQTWTLSSWELAH